MKPNQAKADISANKNKKMEENSRALKHDNSRVLKHESIDSGIGFTRVSSSSKRKNGNHSNAVGRLGNADVEGGLEWEFNNEDCQDKKLPFACYRHDYSASVVGSPHFLKSQIHRPHEYTFKQFDKLHRSVVNYKQQLRNLALAAEDMKREMEEICDAIPLSSAVAENESMVENIDYHIDLNQILANTCLNWEKTLEEQVEQPMALLLRSIPVQAAEVVSRKNENARRRRDRYSNIRMHGKSFIFCVFVFLTILMPTTLDAMDSVAHDLVPSITNLLSKQLDAHLDAVETTNEAIEKVKK